MTRTTRLLVFLTTALALLLTLTACQTSQPLSESLPAAETVDTVLVDEYRIGVDDVVLINVWRNDDLTVEVPVRPDGMISAPLIGDVRAADRTPEAVSTEIGERLAAYIRDPIVSVVLTQINSDEYLSRVRVTGAVTAPIALPYRRGMTVLDAVLEAGGVTEFAAPDRSRLYRKEGNTMVAYPVALNAILNRGVLETNYPLQPGDVITVPERTL